MAGFPRPRVVFSRCLGFEACRYNGQIIASEAVEQFRPFFDCVTVCPEKEIGLGVPREPIRIVRNQDRVLSHESTKHTKEEDVRQQQTADASDRLVQPATGRDITGEMNRFAAGFLAALGPADGFVLKSRSPSCGLFDTRVFPGALKSSPLADKVAGFFGRQVLARYPQHAVEDEGRLTNFRIREHFLTRVYTSARFRALADTVHKSGAAGRLVQFHAENKLLMMGYNQVKMRALGRVVANPGQRPVAEVYAEYGRQLPEVFARLPRPASAVNVLEHALGYFKDRVSAAEKRFFKDALESYRAGRAPLSVPQSVVRAWVVRFGEEYLAQQTFFRPYPEELLTISDSGKGREL